MKVLVTGATGFIGKHLIVKLAEGGFKIKAMFRDETRILAEQHENIEWFKGDITCAEQIKKAVDGCDIIFHLAAYAKVWAPKHNTFHEINYLGTKNILDAALQHNVKKVIIASTAGIFGPSVNNQAVNENTIRSINFFSAYEKSKHDADRMIIDEYAEKLPVCMVCPTRVFGPGELSESNSVTKLIALYIRGQFRFLPGKGLSVGNYVYIDDVVNGMLLALAHGISGEQYILGGDDLSYLELFNHISALSNTNTRLLQIPVPVIITISGIMKFLAVTLRIRPALTPGWARKYMYNWRVSSQKAMNELGYRPTPVKLALRKTLVWILSVAE